MSAIVLDAGALIALARDDKEMWGAVRWHSRRDADILAPSTAIAQAWRGGAKQANLGRALELCVVAGFDELHRRVGELCGRAKTSDICDAHVALITAIYADAVYTSDPDDLAHLLGFCGPGDPRVIRC